MERVISVNHVSFRYDGNEAVSDVSFSASAGDYIALVGHNGSGKTTLVKLILGILTPSSGNISLFGKNVRAFSSWDTVGYLPQNIGLFNPLFPATVREVVALGLISQKSTPKRFNRHDTKAVDEALEQMGIADLADKRVGELSGGQMQRVLLARAIVNKPKLLILDEPASAVDANARGEFFSYIGTLNKDQKTTIILITHDVAHSGGYANKLLFLDKTLVFYGNFGQFCTSQTMQHQFGAEIQHIICHQH
ncbi:metal ABC transporter ATP-binding protein [Patescibacteria group bacterium]|nr:metal ABC transporter ATP-binding protein [Patescibacteria group bacterium]MBU1472489.1 metal ABC transporter ATP-binding protein [Patescibacteria group bacterium]MBU2460303.1 metal ABC transporter ATP-binding protein [Patescibacteria group bacterium]MBU2543839.1 metal ABC transporter ATP-binding protein [Patescibacteria group bacterium]